MVPTRLKGPFHVTLIKYVCFSYLPKHFDKNTGVKAVNH